MGLLVAPIYLLGSLPLAISRFLLLPLAVLMLWLKVPAKPLADAKANLKHCFPHWPKRARDRLYKKYVVQVAQIVADSAWLLTRNLGDLQKKVRVKGAAAPWLKAKSPAEQLIFAVPHNSCIDIGCYWLASYWPTASPFTPYRSDKPPSPWSSLRYHHNAKHAPKLLLAPSDLGGLRELRQALQRGSHLFLPCDQVPRQPRFRKQAVEFFGKRAFFSSLPMSFASRSGHRLCSLVTVRRPFGWDIWIEPQSPLASWRPKDGEGMGNLASTLQRQIMRAPEQHHWHYRHFASQKPDIYG